MDTISEISHKVFNHDLIFRSVKIADIGYITSIYFILAIASVMLINKVVAPFDLEANKKKSVVQLALECVAQIFVAGVIVYILRNLVEMIPSPLQGVAGLKHEDVKELSGVGVVPFIFMFFQNGITGKVQLLMDKINAGDYGSHYHTQEEGETLMDGLYHL